MSVESAKLFDIELPEPIAAAARKVTALSGHAIETTKAKKAEVGRVVGLYHNGGLPRLVLSPKVKPSMAEVALEVLRLELRDCVSESRMPYAEMRHEENQRLCRWLYRIVEQEILLAVGQTHGIEVRQDVRDRLTASFLDKVEAGTYRKKESEPGRTRSATLDGLELLVSYVDPEEAHCVLCKIASIDDGVAAKLGLIYKVVESNRPFDDTRRVRAAYYLAVPFLFDTRRPARPKLRIR